MEIEKIKKIIITQKEETEDFFKNEKIIQRDLNLEKLKKFLKYPNIFVISGVRRSGKSTLALQLLENKKYGCLNFDDERLAGFTENDFDKVLQGMYELFGDLDYFIFDEIQNIKNWELFANRLRRTKRIIITGSNASLLSGELSTRLTGRYIDFTLYPFSFKEFLAYKGAEFKKEDFYSTKKISQIKRHLSEYIKIGGFPEVYKFGGIIAGKIFNDIISKDILLRYGIKNQSTFKELSNYLISNFSKEMGYAKLANIFSIKDAHTAKNYVSYLHLTYMIFILEKFSFKLKQKAIAPKKIYGIDTGLINSLAFQFSENKGRLMENIVLLDFLREKSYNNNNSEIYYWQDYDGREVDFVVKSGRKIIQLIQVCANLDEFQTKEREIKSLLKASDELRCNNLMVITHDYESEEKIENKKVKFVSLWKWLLRV